MRRTSFGKSQFHPAQRLCRPHLRRGPGPPACGRVGRPRRPHRLGRTGPAGGSVRPPDRPVVLRPLDAGGLMSAGRQITSLTNPTVKAVRALHLRKEREETGLFLAEGLKLIGEALEIGHTPTLLLCEPEARSMAFLQRVAQATQAAGGEVIEVTRDILEKVSRRDNPQ